jgi:hypothetical protein
MGLESRTKTYEELRGAEGRQIFFRAQRYKSQDLFRRAVPDLVINRVPHTLDNVSMSGLAAVSPPTDDQVLLVRQPVSIQLRMGGDVLFSGQGQVVRTEETHKGMRLGISLKDCRFDPREVVAQYDELEVRRSLSHFSSLDHSLVPEAYRAICADVINLFRAYNETLEEAERMGNPEGAAKVLAACEEHIVPRWQDLWRKANAIVEPLMDDPEALRAAKRYTEVVLTPDFMPGAIIRRSYEKPLGYPGDFQIMQMAYDWKREGKTLHEKLIHRIGLDVGEMLTNRMVMMREIIARMVLEDRDRPVRATSVGCGPAREVSDYLKVGSLPRKVDFTLIDQDHEALSYAYESTYADVLRHGGKASVNCLHAAFNQLFHTEELFGRLAEQDLIYTLGLVDYLKPRRARVWVQSLFQYLAPGGRLVVSNLYKSPNSSLWPLEFVCDWTLFYRTEEDMLALAEGLDASSVTTEIDPSGRVCMLTIRK